MIKEVFANMDEINTSIQTLKRYCKNHYSFRGICKTCNLNLNCISDVSSVHSYDTSDKQNMEKQNKAVEVLKKHFNCEMRDYAGYCNCCFFFSNCGNYPKHWHKLDKEDCLDKVNMYLKFKSRKGLYQRYAFEYKGEIYLLSTTDVAHGDEEFARHTSYMFRYSTKVFKNFDIDEFGIKFGEELWAMTYSCEDDAKAEHEELVKQIKAGTADELYRSVNARDRR